MFHIFAENISSGKFKTDEDEFDTVKFQIDGKGKFEVGAVEFAVGYVVEVAMYITASLFVGSVLLLIGRAEVAAVAAELDQWFLLVDTKPTGAYRELQWFLLDTKVAPISDTLMPLFVEIAATTAETTFILLMLLLGVGFCIPNRVTEMWSDRI